LEKGEYQMTVWEDGKNADRNGTDFGFSQTKVGQSSKITIHLAKGGGWVARIKTTKN
jgi:alpha-glucosidase